MSKIDFIQASLLLLIAALPALAACDGAGAGPDPSLEEQVDEYMSAYVDLAFFDGVILVARGDEILLAKGYGTADFKSGGQVRTDTKIRVASIAKPFTELAVGRLIEDGTLDRDTPVSAWIPGFPRGDDITVGHLLDNRSGVAHTNSLPWYDQFDRRDWALDELVARLKQEPLNFEPGSQFAYTNGGYVLLAAIIEAASGTSYGNFLQDEVFAPLGMTNSGHEGHDADVPGLATGHVPATTTLNGRDAAPYVEMSLKIGGGSVYSTAEDLLSFANALYSDRLVAEDTWQMLLPPSGSVLSFSGRQPGYNSWLYKDLENEVTVIALANNYAAGMLQQTTEAIANMVLGNAYEPPLVSGRYDADTAYLQTFAGTYDVPDGTTVELEVREDVLAVIEDGEIFELMVPVRENVFILRLTWAEVAFQFGSDGSSVTGAEVTLLVDGTRLPIVRR